MFAVSVDASIRAVSVMEILWNKKKVISRRYIVGFYCLLDVFIYVLFMKRRQKDAVNETGVSTDSIWGIF